MSRHALGSKLTGSSKTLCHSGVSVSFTIVVDHVSLLLLPFLLFFFFLFFVPLSCCDSFSLATGSDVAGPVNDHM